MRSQISRFIPPIFGDVLHNSRMCFQHRKVRHIVAKNSVLRGLHKGRRCFILATGPSIQQQDLTPLKDELCISVSNFFVHEHYDQIKPAYHCIAPWHPPITLEQLGAWMNEVQEKTGEATLVLSASDYETHQRENWFPGRKCVHLSLLKPHDNPDSYRELDCSGILPSITSVPVMAIYLAMFLGCTPIYLLGTDHDWIFHFGESRHFYKESSHALSTRGYNEWEGLTLLDEFHGYVRLWSQYKYLRTRAEMMGIRIENATGGGILDIFPRAALTDLVGAAEH
jgi:hypothetical protein